MQEARNIATVSETRSTLDTLRLFFELLDHADHGVVAIVDIAAVGELGAVFFKAPP